MLLLAAGTFYFVLVRLFLFLFFFLFFFFLHYLSFFLETMSMMQIKILVWKIPGKSRSCNNDKLAHTHTYFCCCRQILRSKKCEKKKKTKEKKETTKYQPSFCFSFFCTGPAHGAFFLLPLLFLLFLLFLLLLLQLFLIPPPLTSSLSFRSTCSSHPSCTPSFHLPSLHVWGKENCCR